MQILIDSRMESVKAFFINFEFVKSFSRSRIVCFIDFSIINAQFILKIALKKCYLNKIY